MKCIYCSSETQVVNSRPQKRANNVWRRRQCLSCKAVFTTIETADLEKSLVVNNGKRLKPFLRDKLFAAIYDSLKHRKTALSDATALTDTIVSDMLKLALNGMIESEQIIVSCHKTLTRFDKTAAVFYVAYHPLG